MLYFGVAGWSYPDWKGIVYPADRKKGMDELTYIATFFDTIELNNTFYRIPESKVVESWVKRVAHNPKFRFTAKLWQGFTHGKRDWQEADAKQFSEAIEPLRKSERLGALLIQFPVSFRSDEDNRSFLERLSERFGDLPLVVEFRNRSWVSSDTLDWLESHGIGFCNVDEPRFREMIRPSSVVTGPTGYVRFHGRNYKNWFAKEGNRDTRYDYLYSEDELDEWIPRIQEMGKKAKDVYVIGNNHFRGQAPANVLQLKSKTTRGPVEVPAPMLDSFPQLAKVAKSTKRPAKQHRLDFEVEESKGQKVERKRSL